MDIFAAIHSRDFEAFKKALFNKKNLTLNNSDYRMEPLRWAAIHGRTEMVKLLRMAEVKE